MIPNEENFDRKYTPNLKLRSEHFRDQSGRFETFANDIITVLGQEEKFVWTCVDGDDGLYYVSGYHLVNRVYYLITNEPWEQVEEYLIESYED